MKKIITLIILSISLLSCGGCEPDIPQVEKITSVDNIFQYESLINSGFKKSKSYKVEELPESIGAYYGWKEVGEEGRKDFEIRIYNSHEVLTNYKQFNAYVLYALCTSVF